MEEVERRGMAEVGIYRLSGSTTDINMLKASFNSSKKTHGKNTNFLRSCEAGQEFKGVQGRRRMARIIILKATSD